MLETPGLKGDGRFCRDTEAPKLAELAERAQGWRSGRAAEAREGDAVDAITCLDGAAVEWVEQVKWHCRFLLLLWLRKALDS